MTRLETAMNWDLSDPINYLVNREKQDPHYIHEMAGEYRKFLGLIASNPHYRFPISDAVDLMWHTHLLFTADYAKMSEAVRGSFIGHKPILTTEEREEVIPAYINGTLKEYERLYGPPSAEWWPTEGAICWCGRVH